MMYSIRFTHIFSFLMLFILAVIMNLHDAKAQGSVQVQVLGVPGMLDSPVVADQVNRFETGQYPIQIVYTAPTNRTETFRFLFTLEKDGRRIAEVESEPVTLAPGFYLYNNFRSDPPIEFRESLNQVIRSLPGDERSSFTSGLFPEGSYTLTIEPVPEDRFSMISTLPGFVQFMVSYGQPPMLISPGDASEVIQPFPVFTWSPVVAPADVTVEYEIRIVELLRGQQPEQAVDGARFPQLETVVQNLTSFMMTPQELPLELGTTYAWQVTARDAFGQYPFRNNGRSEIGLFTYRGLPGEGESLADLDEIVLVPGFARLTALSIDQMEEDDFSYTLNGLATLHIGNPTTLPVQFQDLRIQKTGLDNPVVLGGTVDGSVQNAGLPFTQEATVVEFLDLQWEFGGAFQLSGDIRLPGEEPVASSGTVSWTPGGLQGELTAEAPEGVKIGKNPVEAELSSVKATFPQATISAEGSLALFGENVECQTGSILIGAAGAGLTFDCDIDRDIHMSEGHDLVTLKGNRVVGNLAAEWDGEPEFNLSLAGNLNLNLFTGPDCSSSVQLGINSEDGVSVQSFNSSCITNPSLNLGIGTLHVRNLETPEISYSEEEGWGYRIPWNQDLAFHFERRPDEMGRESGESRDDRDSREETDDGSETREPGDRQPDEEGSEFVDDDSDESTPPEPGREPIRTPADDPSDEPGDDEESDAVSDDGIEFREREYDENQLRNSEGCISGFYVQPKRFHMPEFVLDWADYLPATTTVDFPLEFFFDAELRLGCTTVKPRVEIPECLKNLGVEVTNASYSSGALNAELTTTELPDEGCFTDFGPGFTGDENYGLKLKQIGGSISGSAGINGFEQEGEVWVETALMAGSPFNCGENSESTELLTGDLNVRSDGIFEGELSGHIGCPLEFGGFSLAVTDATVNFRAGEKGQRAKLTGIAELEYEDKNGQTLTSTGSVAINLVTGEIEELYLEIEGPYIWRLTEENPFMEFELEQMILNRNGFFVDASQSLRVADENLSVFFNEVQIGFDGRIKSGKISFMEQLSIRGDLSSGEPSANGLPVSFSLSDADTTLPENLTTGFLLKLGPDVVLDKDGLALAGQAKAGMRFAGLDLPDLDVRFGDETTVEGDIGMRLAFNSPVVAMGQMDILLNNSRIAWLEPGGFFVDEQWYEVLIPETLYLPTADIAYVTLRRNGELLVDYEVQENSVSISTKPGEVLDFEAPFLSQSEIIPQWQVTLNNVVLDRTNWTVMQGEITAVIPDHSEPVNLTPLGLPLAMSEMSFGFREVDGELVRKLFVDGQISMFDHIFDQSPDVMFYVNADGNFGGSLNLTGLDERIELVEGLDFVQLVINGLEIEMNENPNAGANLMNRLTLNFDGGVGFFDGDNPIAYAPVQAEWLNNGSFHFQTTIETNGTPQAHLDLGPVFAGVEDVNQLSMNFQPGAGFTFEMGMDMYMGFTLDGESFTIPIPDIHLDQNRIHIAELNLHRHHDEHPMPTQLFEIYGVQLRPDVVEIGELEINWLDWDPMALLDINPVFDFTLWLSAFENSLNPSLESLSQTEFIIQGATIGDGFLSGEITARTFNGGLQIPIGPVEANLQSASGAFYVDNNTQQFDFGFDALVYNLPGFDSNGEDCDPSEIALQLIGGAEFSGEIQINPCGRRELGPLALEMGQSTLIFSSDQQNQTAILDGEGTLILPPLPDAGIQDSPTATGSIELDLLNFELISGSIDVNVPFRYSLPSLENPFLDLEVNQARLDPEGFTISGSSSLLISDTASLDVALNDLQFSFDTFSVTGGALSIDSAIQLNVGLLGSNNFWNITVPDVGNIDVTPPESAQFSAVFNGGLTLDASGISFSGGAEGRLSIEGMNVEADGPSFYSDLNIQIEDNEEGPFRLALNEPGALLPVSMASGRINFRDGQSVLAYYENNQLEFMGINILATLLPERIPLPSESIAYLDLENSNISEEMVDDTRRLTANGVSLIIEAFGDGNQISATVDNLDVDLNSDYSAITAVYAFDVSIETPELLSKTGFPLTLTGLDYSSTETGFRLSMSALLDLPESMMDHFGLNAEELVIEEITLTEGGFEQGTFALGSYEYGDTTQPLISESISTGVGGEFAIYGIELAIGGQNVLRFSGYFDMDYMASGDDRNPLYYNAIWEGSADTYLWDLEMNLEDQQEINLGLASLGVQEFGGSITMSTQNSSGELHTWITGAIGFSDLLGSEFSLHAEKLGFTVNDEGISVGAEQISYSGENDFSLFDEQIAGSIDEAGLEFEDDVIGISIAGNLIILETEVDFDNLSINTNLDFVIDVSLADTIYIVENYAWIDTIELYKGEDENGQDALRFEGGVGMNLPDGIADGSGVDEISGSLSLTQKNGTVESELGVFVGFTTLADMDTQETSDFNFIELGDLFLFEVRGLGVNVNLKNRSKSQFYGYAGLYFEQENGTWDTDKVVNFGDAAAEEYGVSYDFNTQTFSWSAEATGIDVELGVFNMHLSSLAVKNVDDLTADNVSLPENGQDWWLFFDISGSFQFNVPNVDASTGDDNYGTGAGITFSNFVVGIPPELQNPVVQWPSIDGVQLSIMGIVTVELGSYEYVTGGTITFLEGDPPDDPNEDVPDPEEVIIDVNYYLNFSGASISLANLFKGGVDEVLIYETTTGERRVFIDNANFSMEGADGLMAMALTLNYESSDDRFYIRASGEAMVGDFGLMLSGEFEQDCSGNASPCDYRMGLFIAGRFSDGIPLIPQAPPVISLTGIGGGIFYRPTPEAINDIYNAEFLGVNTENLREWGNPDIGPNTRFAVLLYGSFSMLGEAGFYTMQGNVLIGITNEFVQMNASGILLMQDGYISADLGTGLTWGGEGLTIGGEIYASIEYPVLEGYGMIGYSVDIDFGSPVQVDWGIWGEYQASVIGLDSNGNFYISPVGMFASMDITADIDLKIAALEGILEAKVWAVPDLNNPNLGAFAEANISATAFGHEFAALNLQLAYEQTQTSTYLKGFAAAMLSAGNWATLEGFILVEMKYELLELPDINVEASSSISPELQALIDDASGQAGDMQTAMASTLDFLFQLPHLDVTMSRDELAAAGQTIQQVNQVYNNHPAIGIMASLPLAAVISKENLIYENSQTPEPLQWVNAHVLTNRDFPDGSYLDDSFSELESLSADLNTHKDFVQEQYQNLQTFAISSVEGLEQDIQQMHAPFQEGNSTHSIYGIIINSHTGFHLSQKASKEFRETALSGLSELDPAALYDMDLHYREAITSAIANLNLLDSALDEDLVVHGERYAETHSAMLRYIGEEISRFWQYHQRYKELFEAVSDEAPSILNAVDIAWERILDMNPETCRDIEESSGQASFVNCITVGLDLAVARYNLLTQLGSGAEALVDNELENNVIETRSILFDLLDDNVEPMAYMANNNFTIRQVLNEGQGLIDNTFTVSNTNPDISDVSLADQAAFDTVVSFIENTENSLTESGQNFWYYIHEQAFDALINAYESVAGDFNYNAMQELTAFRNSHHNFTGQIENLFALKVTMSETLFSLLDVYEIFYHQNRLAIESIQDSREPSATPEIDERDDPFAALLISAREPSAGREVPRLHADEILEFKHDLEQWLQPPAITNLAVTSRRLTETVPSPGTTTGENLNSVSQQLFIPSLQTEQVRGRFITENRLQWDLSASSLPVFDAVGNIEMGISGSDGGQPLAIGKTGSFTHYSWLRAADTELTTDDFVNSYNVSLRARSRAGIPVSVNGSFTATVASSADSYSGFPASGTYNPPPEPIVEGATAPNLWGIKINSGQNYPGNWQTWYTNNTDHLTLELSASGASVNRFEVRILSPQNNTVLDWTTVSGVRSYPSGNTVLTGTIQNPGLQENASPYTIQARAVGADGAITSSIVSRNLIVDETSPQWQNEEIDNNSGYSWVDNPAVAPSQMLQGTVLRGVQSALSPAVVSAEPVNLADYNRTIKAEEAVDEISGIRHFEVILNQQETADHGSFASDQMEIVSSTYFENVQLPSFGTWYLHIRALNYAGLYSGVRSYEILHPDPTPPAAPEVAVQPRVNGLRLFLPRLANDPESGIAGYQYQYRSDDGSLVKGWPEDSEDGPVVDFTESNLVSLSSSAPYFRIPIQPASTPVEVQVRAVNGDGTVSQVVSIPNIRFDVNPPLIGSINTQFYHEDGKESMLLFLDVEISNIKTEHAGIREVSVTLIDRETNNALLRRSNVQRRVLPLSLTESFNRIPIPVEVDHQNLDLIIQVESGTGAISKTVEPLNINKKL